VTWIRRIFIHNWPLKLAAIVLASMLYAGLVVSQSVQEYPGTVPITPLNIPSNASLGSTLDKLQVTQIRYVSARDASAPAAANSFEATIDLANVDPNSGRPVYVPIHVTSVDPRFTVVSYEPPGINIQLDPLKDKANVPVRVIQGTIPAGLDVRPPIVDPKTVTVRGPASVVGQVVEVLATVVIEPSGLNVDRQVDLVPVDDTGNRVTPVDVTPATAHVQIAVFSNLRSRPLPVTPVVSGSPAAGYQVTGVTVEPLLVSVEGDADLILGLTQANTEQIVVSGATQDVAKDVALSLPDGVLAVGGDTTVHVTIAIAPISGTRTFDAGIVASGARADLLYSFSVNHALATAGGPLADLERLDAAKFVLTSPVGGLAPGTHQVKLEANLPIGLGIVTIDPPTITVTISGPGAASPSAVP
jgi:YbbR domain-containing protein